jgi:hypothetical protein
MTFPVDKAMSVQLLFSCLELFVKVCPFNQAGTKKKLLDLPVVLLTYPGEVPRTIGLPLCVRGVTTDAIAPVHVLIDRIESEPIAFSAYLNDLRSLKLEHGVEAWHIEVLVQLQTLV